MINPLSEIKTPLPDFGEDDAFLTLISGIFSLFFNPLFSILTFIFAKQYKIKGDGRNIKQVKAGKIMSIFSIIAVFAFLIYEIAKIASIAYVINIIISV